MPSDTPQIWRVPGYFRVIAVLGFGPLALLLLIGAVVSPGTWVIYPFLLALLFVIVGMVRRRCVLSDTELIAQGRFVRRVIPLAELTQVAVNVTGNVFVQTRTPRFNGGDICMLRMIPTSRTEFSGTPAAEAVQQIRRHAEERGATLQPEPDKPVPTHSKKPLVFSI